MPKLALLGALLLSAALAAFCVARASAPVKSAPVAGCSCCSQPVSRNAFLTGSAPVHP